MKCPHCNVAFAENFASTSLSAFPEVHSRTGEFLAPQVAWTARHQRCPECHEVVIFLEKLPYGRKPNAHQPGVPQNTLQKSFMAHPHGIVRPVPPEVPSPYRDDFEEACKVLADSPKASAALSRRCLQQILIDKGHSQKKNLIDQIDEVVNSNGVPAHIAESLHAVRQIGNFAAHTQKSTTTGVILDVEPGEAEWNLDVIESLFDFYFVQPALTAKRKAALNPKLKDAGKQTI